MRTKTKACVIVTVLGRDGLLMFVFTVRGSCSIRGSFLYYSAFSRKPHMKIKTMTLPECSSNSMESAQPLITG